MNIMTWNIKQRTFKNKMQLLLGPPFNSNKILTAAFFGAVFAFFSATIASKLLSILLDIFILRFLV